jgi:hypothetical protein
LLESHYRSWYGGVTTGSFRGGTVFVVPLFWHDNSSNPQGFYKEYKGTFILQCSCIKERLFYNVPDNFASIDEMFSLREAKIGIINVGRLGM